MKKIIFLILLLAILISPLMVSAQTHKKGIDSGSKVDIENPLGKNVTPQVLIGRVINAALGIVGSLALIMFVYGGLVWMTAAGNTDKIAKGRSILMWATIGMVVVFSSYTLVRFIIERGLGA